MIARAFLIALLLMLLNLQGDRARAVDSQIYSKLAASRDALLAQQREIQRSYDDISHQMDELKRKQALLDGYAKETESAIREVERAMNQ